MNKNVLVFVLVNKRNPDYLILIIMRNIRLIRPFHQTTTQHSTQTDWRYLNRKQNIVGRNNSTLNKNTIYHKNSLCRSKPHNRRAFMVRLTMIDQWRPREFSYLPDLLPICIFMQILRFSLNLMEDTSGKIPACKVLPNFKWHTQKSPKACFNIEPPKVTFAIRLVAIMKEFCVNHRGRRIQTQQMISLSTLGPCHRLPKDTARSKMRRATC